MLRSAWQRHHLLRVDRQRHQYRDRPAAPRASPLTACPSRYRGASGVRTTRANSTITRMKSPHTDAMPSTPCRWFELIASPREYSAFAHPRAAAGRRHGRGAKHAQRNSLTGRYALIGPTSTVGTRVSTQQEHRRRRGVFGDIWQLMTAVTRSVSKSPPPAATNAPLSARRTTKPAHRPAQPSTNAALAHGGVNSAGTRSGLSLLITPSAATTGHGNAQAQRVADCRSSRDQQHCHGIAINGKICGIQRVTGDHRHHATTTSASTARFSTAGNLRRTRPITRHKTPTDGRSTKVTPKFGNGR